MSAQQNALPEPPRSQPDERPLAQYRIHPSGRHLLRRGPAEAIATAVIAAGLLMLMQPISMTLYTYSFVTTLIGTGLFVVVSKFPE